MKACIQRVSRARVTVGGSVCGEIGRGMLVFLGVVRGDTEAEVAFLAEKVAGLRIFDDAAGKMNLSVREISGSVLVVSQFTLAADCRRGKRPSFTDAAPPEIAEDFYEKFITEFRTKEIPVQSGIFRAMMDVELVNDGPVTIWLDSEHVA